METYFLKNEDLFKFYEHIAQEYELYVPVKAESPLKYAYDCKPVLPTDDYYLKNFSQVEKEEIVFNEYRAVEPTRAFFAHYKEELANAKERPQALCGIKNCDIFSLKVQDFVFLGGDEVDPFYKARRDNTLLIASDCPHFKEVCFCRAFDIDPYPVEGFDFNLSPLNNGYLLDVASQKAKMIALSLKNILTPAT
ncbi:MAG: hypothetical protein PHO03_00985, partial [Candidatus Omnitrophica bacterium]|nr:hypothetical protein [Candidatus Omnitrophota bacterium]